MFGREPTTFEECGLPASMVKHLTENIGFGAPTAVQAKTIPRMLAGRDVLVRAETGSGKTLSYIAPLFSKIGGILPRVTRNEGTRGLVLVPTRELATQVEDTARLVGRPFHWVVTSSIMGGENRGKEKARLRKGVCLLIATPGRLLDHLRMTESFNVDNLRWLVLGSRSIIRFRIRGRFERHLERDRSSNGGASLCTALLSATLTPGTARLAERMTDPSPSSSSEEDDLEIVGDGDDGEGDDVDANANADALKRMVKIMTGGERVRMPEGLNHTVVEVSMKARLPRSPVYSRDGCEAPSPRRSSSSPRANPWSTTTRPSVGSPRGEGQDGGRRRFRAGSVRNLSSPRLVESIRRTNVFRNLRRPKRASCSAPTSAREV